MQRATRAVACALAALLAAPATAGERPLARGEYLFRIAGCENCHTDRAGKGAAFAGGRALATPLGTFYTPNITPDRDTGIGRWSEADFLRALREGVSPSGAHYYPSFPYAAYTRLSDDDLRALWAHLRGLTPVHRPNRPHALPWYLRARPLLAVWKWRYFEPGAYVARPDRSAAWNRGAYLAEAAAHCAECHTPRDRFGGLDRSRYLAGTRDGPEGGVVPNITPDRATGIGRWRASELAQYLESGMTPDGDFAGDLMAEVIDNGLRVLTREDRAAIVEYLRSVPAVEHAVRKTKPGAKERQRDEFGY